MEVKWDLSEIYLTKEDLQSDMDKLKEIGNKIISTKGTLATKQGLLNFYNISQEFSLLKDKISSYLFLTKSLDGSSVFALEKIAQLENYLQDHSTKTTFAMQEIKKIPNNLLLEWSNQKEFKDFDNDLKDIIKILKQILNHFYLQKMKFEKL